MHDFKSPADSGYRGLRRHRPLADLLRPRLSPRSAAAVLPHTCHVIDIDTDADFYMITGGMQYEVF